MDYTVLGLNGGGMRGVLQIGALQSLSEEKNEKYLHNIFTDGIYGISIGALIATLIAFEFSVDELDVLSEMLGNMQDAFQPLRLQSLLSFTQKNGIDDGSTIYTMIVREFEKKGMDFANLRIGDAAVPLYIVASNVTTLKTTVFGQSMKVWDALRSSISMPYIFTPHVINDQMYVDGAILCRRIVDVIPVKDREKMILLLIAQSKGVTAENYMSALPLCSNNRDTHAIQRSYPKNACLLIEDDAQMFTFWESADIVRHLLRVGRSNYGKFRSESVHQESPENT